MNKNGMLAAVSAAAAGIASGDTSDNGGKVPLAAPGDAATSAAASFTQADLDAARKAGADAERERILGIEKAAMPGHEAIVAAHKADATKTPGDTALAIIAAENAARGAQMAALNTDEAKTKVPAQPANATTAPAAAAGEGREGPEKYKAEWDGNPKLAEEFSSFEAYSAFRSMEDQGRVRMYSRKA